MMAVLLVPSQVECLVEKYIGRGTRLYLQVPGALVSA